MSIECIFIKFLFYSKNDCKNIKMLFLQSFLDLEPT